ncbi:putative pre-rRNA processing protein [Aspergillus undulatus]|uniref:putative pre-rRNA processing protein n=1 Tax=Aspergillus undulatus TaxID=1810928 RepID=UPI003CCDE17C
MVISNLLSRRVRARPDEDEEVYSDDSGSGSEPPSEDEGSAEGSDSGSEGSLDGDDDLSNSDQEASDLGSEEDSDLEEENNDEDVKSSLNNISFGALAKAQASFAPKSKRRTKTLKEKEAPTKSPLDDIRARIQEAREQKRKTSAASSKDNSNPNPTSFDKPPSRSSKHAPTVQSSKYAVSRKRTIIEPPSVPRSRDPRFDPTIVGRRGGGSSSGPGNAYAFLDEYRAAELKDLKTELAKTKDPKRKDALSREIRSTTDRLRSIENNKREREILAEHKKREKQLIREGKKASPYYLKKSDVKKQALLKKYEGMKSKDRAKALERRRKKAASKERKEMPMERRGFGGGDDEAPRKRQRLD